MEIKKNEMNSWMIVKHCTVTYSKYTVYFYAKSSINYINEVHIFSLVDNR